MKLRKPLKPGSRSLKRTVGKSKYIPDQLGLFVPDSDWAPPASLPDLRGRRVVALDCETRDIGLQNKQGPGWAWLGGGLVCGISWAAEDSNGYASVTHPDGHQFPQAQMVRWLTDLVRS